MRIGSNIPKYIWVSVYPNWKYNIITRESSFITREDFDIDILDLSPYFEEMEPFDTQNQYVHGLQKDITEITTIANRNSIINQIYSRMLKENIPITEREVKERILESLQEMQTENKQGRH